MQTIFQNEQRMDQIRKDDLQSLRDAIARLEKENETLPGMTLFQKDERAKTIHRNKIFIGAYRRLINICEAREVENAPASL